MGHIHGKKGLDDSHPSPDHVLAQVLFDNGVRAFLRATPTGVASWEIDVIGTEGRIRSIANCTQMEYIRTAPGGNRGRGVPAYVPFPYPTHIPGMGITIIDDLVEAIGLPKEQLCTYCWDGCEGCPRSTQSKQIDKQRSNVAC